MTATSTSRPERPSAVGDFPSYNIISDLTKKTTLLGTDATHYIGVYYNAEQSYNYTYNVAPGRQRDARGR